MLNGLGKKVDFYIISQKIACFETTCICLIFVAVLLDIDCVVMLWNFACAAASESVFTVFEINYFSSTEELSPL